MPPGRYVQGCEMMSYVMLCFLPMPFSYFCFLESKEIISLNTVKSYILFSAHFILIFIIFSKSAVNEMNFVILGVPSYKSHVFTIKLVLVRYGKNFSDI